MSDLIKLVKTYRLTHGLAQQLELAERILPLIQYDIKCFVHAPPIPPMPEDAYQEALKAIFTNLGQFRGDSRSVFFGWCWRITRNKVNKQISKHLSDPLHPMSDDEFLKVAESCVAASGLSPGDRLDLEYAMKLLDRSKPECGEYLRNHYLLGLDYTEIAAACESTRDAVRMQIRRCIEEARKLIE